MGNVRIKILALGIVTMLVIGTLVAVISAQSNEQHCVQSIEDQQAQQVCFPTIAEAFSYITDGQVNLSPETSADEVTGAYRKWRAAQQPEATSELIPPPSS
jgi:hypothetical protein